MLTRLHRVAMERKVYNFAFKIMDVALKIMDFVF